MKDSKPFPFLAFHSGWLVVLAVAFTAGCSRESAQAPQAAVSPQFTEPADEGEVLSAFNGALSECLRIAEGVDDKGVRAFSTTIAVLKTRVQATADLKGYSEPKHEPIREQILGALACWNGVLLMDELSTDSRPSEFWEVGSEFDAAYGAERFKQIRDMFKERQESPYLSGEFRTATLNWAKHRLETAAERLSTSGKGNLQASRP